MEMKLKSLIHLIPLLFLTSMPLKAIPAVASPDIIKVPDEYSVIQWAINAANPGDTIVVSPGTYNERIIVNKTVNLVGQNRDTTVISAQGTGTVITVTASNVNISGFTIKNGGWGITGGYLVFNNIVENNEGGIEDAKIIKNNIIRNNGVDFFEGWGILAHNSLIEGNTVLDNSNGIEAHGSTVQNNLVKNENSFWGYGLKVGGCLVVGNTIKENYGGVYVSTMGYWGNTIYHNNFIDNEEQVVNYEYYQESAWDNGAEGNYWSDYKGKDANGDGIGDTLLPHLNIDNCPLIQPWSEVRTFDTYTWRGVNYQVKTLSNNTIASFRYDHDLKYVSFNITGPSGTVGFCDVTIPKPLLIGPWLVLIDGRDAMANTTIIESISETFVYLTYNFSTHMVKIIGTEALDIVSPIANAGPDQTANEDTLVTFDGSGSTDNIGITKYTWSFDDTGTLVTLIGVNPTYIFSTPGNYNVTLNVTDAIGNYDADTVLIKVLDVTKPVANAGSDQTVKVGTTVQFDASASTDNVGIVSYEWNYGDEFNGTGITTTHTYSSPGNYIVTLTVKDAAGNSDTDMINIIVEAEFPWWIVGVIVTGIVVGIIFYLTKLRKTTLQ